VGVRRGPLPVQVGSRFPARLPLRVTLHPAAPGRAAFAGVLLHGHRQARRGGRHLRPLRGTPGGEPGAAGGRGEPGESELRGAAGARPGQVCRGAAPAAGGPAGRGWRHRVLRAAEDGGGGGPLPEGGRPGLRLLPRRHAAGRQAPGAGSLPGRQPACDRRHQRLRHGGGQARRAPGDPPGYARFAGELPAGGRAGRARPGTGALHPALRRSGFGRAVSPAQELAPDPARHPLHPQGPAHHRAQGPQRGGGGGDQRRDPAGSARVPPPRPGRPRCRYQGAHCRGLAGRGPPARTPREPHPGVSGQPDGGQPGRGHGTPAPEARCRGRHRALPADPLHPHAGGRRRGLVHRRADACHRQRLPPPAGHAA
jgi:hypothetical protein